MSDTNPPEQRNDDSHTTFIRQGSWLVGTTLASGLFMVATQSAAARWMSDAEYNVWFALLKVFLLMSIPSVGLQVLFAQQAAAAVTEERRRRLVGTIHGVLKVTFVLWLGMVLVALGLQGFILKELKINNPTALWVTLAIGLPALWTPVFRGVLQGRQQFAGLGWSLILDGVGRFFLVTFILLLGGQAAGGLTGALISQLAAILLGAWLFRDLLFTQGSRCDWGAWCRRGIPLTVGAGAVLFMYSVDVIFVQSSFPENPVPPYMPANMVGFGLFTFTTPLAMVMFPKVARSAALTTSTRVLEYALGATALCGGAAALACTLFPELPLRIIYFGNPDKWAAAALVPWFAWCLLPLIMANVVLGNLLARERFAVVPWLAIVAVAYAVGLRLLRPYLLDMETAAAFRSVIAMLGVSGLVLLAVTIFFSWKDPGRTGVGVEH